MMRTDVQIGDYVLCWMEFEGSKWVRVDEFHDDVSEVSGLPYGPGFSGEVIIDHDCGDGMPVFNVEMSFPLSCILQVKRFDWGHEEH